MRYLIALGLSALFLFAEAWAFMVLVGVVHGEWLPGMPTIGYWSAVKVGFALSLLTCICAAAYGFGKGLMGDE